MDDERVELYAGIIALVILGLLTMLSCVLCKFCLTSKRIQQWSGFDKFLSKVAKGSAKNDKSYTQVRF